MAGPIRSPRRKRGRRITVLGGVMRPWGLGWLASRVWSFGHGRGPLVDQLVLVKKAAAWGCALSGLGPP